MICPILYVTDTLRPLGDAFQLNVLLRASSEDEEVHVAVTGQTASAFNPLSGSNVQVHYLKHAAAKNVRGAVREQVASAWKLGALVKKLRPKIVHAWGYRAEQVVGLSQMLCRQDMSPAKRVCTHASQLPRTRFLTQQFDRAARRHFSKVVIPHPSMRDALSTVGYERSQITIIPNAATAPQVADTARSNLLDLLGLKEDAGQKWVIAATVALFTPATRLKDLIWATDLLNCVRDDFHFVIFGTGEGRAALERFTGFTLAQKHVHFIEADQSLELLRAIDVYWHSHLQSPLPSPLLSAMASEVPVISVYGDGTREVIRHQETGLAVNFGARDEFARWTKYIIEKPESATQLAAQGKEFVDRTFPVDGLIAAYRELYGSLAR